jgi:hypothetical protein
MVFGSHVPAEKVMSMIRAFRDQQERELATLREQKRLMKETAKERPELVFPLLSMRYGELVNQAYIDWCNEAEARIQAMAPSGETP